MCEYVARVLCSKTHLRVFLPSNHATLPPTSMYHTSALAAGYQRVLGFRRPPGLQGVKTDRSPTGTRVFQPTDRLLGARLWFVFRSSFIESPSLAAGNAFANQTRNVLHSFAGSVWEDVSHREARSYTSTVVINATTVHNTRTSLSRTLKKRAYQSENRKTLAENTRQKKWLL